jgi:hypothetical protein
MNNLFKCRKVSKKMKMFSDSFLGVNTHEIDEELK